MSPLYSQTIARLHIAYGCLSRAVHQVLGATLAPNHPLHDQGALAQVLVPLLAAGLEGRTLCATAPPPASLMPWCRSAYAALPQLHRPVGCAFTRLQAADGVPPPLQAAVQEAEVSIVAALAQVNELLLVLLIWEDADPGGVAPPAAAPPAFAPGSGREYRA